MIFKSLFYRNYTDHLKKELFKTAATHKLKKYLLKVQCACKYPMRAMSDV